MSRDFFSNLTRIRIRLYWKKSVSLCRIYRGSRENLAKNEELRARVQAIADAKKCSLSQLALAWVHHRGKDLVPIPGMQLRTTLMCTPALL